MEGGFNETPEPPRFQSPEEELNFLREQIAQKERQLEEMHQPIETETVVREKVEEYTAQEPEAVLAPEYKIGNTEFEAIVSGLESKVHQDKIRELYSVIEEKGVMNAISVARALNNPHIYDDLHRVLVQYVKTGTVLPKLEKNTELSNILHTTLFEITLPSANPDQASANFKEASALMHEFFGGMSGMGDAGGKKEHYTLELVLSNYSSDVVFYVATPDRHRDLLQKQLLSVFPSAHIEIKPTDYNIFNESGVSLASYVTTAKSFAFPVRIYEDFESDPIKALINAFSNIEREGEGAAIQIVIKPNQNKYIQKYKHAIEQIKQGIPVNKATDIPLSTGGAVAKEFGSFFFGSGVPKKTDEPVTYDTDAVELIETKIKDMLVGANIRIVASAGDAERAEAILGDLESAFTQFNHPQSNEFVAHRYPKGKLAEALHNFSYRTAEEKRMILLNTKEAATVFHFPMNVSATDIPQLKQARSASAPAPMELPSEGIVLGVNKYRGEEREIHMTKSDRLRHCYVIGQTGTGKTTLLKNMIIQDIQNGDGVCMIDPHGSDIDDILANIPKERMDDVIYFDPAYTPRPLGLNMLEYDHDHPEQKTFVVNEMLSIFNKLFDMKSAGGPMFEQYFRNATMLVIEDPESGNTLLEISRVLADAKFREMKLSRCKNPIVVQFWREVAGKAGGEASLANMVPYITSKFDVFLSNDIMRPIVAQEHSAFNFRQIMDEQKILLVNLSKGRLGDINANLIGLILVGKILMAALSRVDALGKEPLNDFYLYIDEFQNVTTDSISAILSEARKYGLSLNIAHQYIGQLEASIKDSVFGNVGSMAVFRVGAEDAQYLESQFSPVFTAADIMKLDNYNAYLKPLIAGVPVTPFNLVTLAPPKGHPENIENIKTLTYLKYGKDRREVEEEVMKKYASASVKPAAPSPKKSAG